MYLWKRNNGFTYQQRIPISVESKFGKTPIRVNLGPLSAAEAKKRAIILSGSAIQLMDDPAMTRETLIHSLRALSKELSSLQSQRFALTARIGGMLTEADEFRENGQRDGVEYFTTQARTLSARKEALADYQERLKSISDALSKDAVAWESERETFQSVVRTLGSLGANMSAVQPVQHVSQVPSEPTIVNALQDVRTATASTRFGVAGQIILDSRKAALDVTDADSGRYEERLQATFDAFLNIVGDHPMSYYLPIHLQDFATAMGRVPTNRSKYPIFKGLSLEAMGEKNDALPEGKKVRRLSQTSVKEHVTQIKLIWEKATAGVAGGLDTDTACSEH